MDLHKPSDNMTEIHENRVLGCILFDIMYKSCFGMYVCRKALINMILGRIKKFNKKYILVIGCWLLVIGYWLLVMGYWSLFFFVMGYWLLAIGF